jgi:hydrogenase maturation protease
MKRVLVAGIGNLFFGDDGFGVEVARTFSGPLPAGARVADFGIRALHLAYELLAPLDLLVIVDCVSRGGTPGTLYVIEPEHDVAATAVADAHGMNLPVVFAMLRELGGALPRTLVVGCEPENIESGVGLSPSVTRSIPSAIELVRELITSQQEPI